MTGSALSGCAQLESHPPRTLEELQAVQTEGSESFTRDTIVLYNLGRVCDDKLPVKERSASLAVVDQLDGKDELCQSQVAAILSQEDCPMPLRHAVLAWLIRNDYPDLAPHVAQALPLAEDAEFRAALLDWLARNPDSQVLAEVVKRWAAEKVAVGSPLEARYRLAMEALAGKTWSEALLDALNRPGFLARGSALEVLAARLDSQTLGNSVLLLDARSDAVSAMQCFLRQFGFLPDSRHELLAAVTIHVTKPDQLQDAHALAEQWKSQGGYSFNICDFHLLSRLARDSARPAATRDELVRQVSDVIANRAHTYRLPKERNSSPETQPDWARAISALSIVDLQNLLLLNEMLCRPRVQLDLAGAAGREQADQIPQCGGLIFLQDGRAEARLYPPVDAHEASDYTPSDLMLRDAADCLMQFVAHFERAENAQRIGPDEDEVPYARMMNCYQAILTSVDRNTFNVTYCNPRGMALNLGDYPFGQEAAEASK